MGFYDFKGYWRSYGEGFYDAKGYFRSWGEGFYDARGYFRSWGEGFYDARGYFRSWGEGFYDSKGYFRSGIRTSTRTTSNESVDATAIIGILLFVPIGLLWLLAIVLIEWITAHLYITFIGYAIVAAVITYIVTKIKRHQGRAFTLSFIGNYACMMSLIYIVLVYAVPDVVKHGSGFGSFVGLIMILVLSVGGIAVVQFFNYYHERAFLEFVVGLLFFGIVIILLRKNGTDINELVEIYNVQDVKILKLLLGIYL